MKVGETGFEPATLWSQTRCATGLRYSPFKRKIATHAEWQLSHAGGEGGIRTPGTPIGVRQFSKLLV